MKQPLVTGCTRPFSDTRITEVEARKRSLCSRVNRATTAGCLTPTGYTAYLPVGPGGLPLALRLSQGHHCSACEVANGLNRLALACRGFSGTPQPPLGRQSTLMRLLFAEDDALHQRVIDVMNACAAAKLKNVTFGTGG